MYTNTVYEPYKLPNMNPKNAQYIMYMRPRR